jgi:hypothetical protein
MTCETCAAPGGTLRLIGTTESLCVACFLKAHPPQAESFAPPRLGCLANLRRRRHSFPGRCRSV